jgi:hypothetical protein
VKAARENPGAVDEHARRRSRATLGNGCGISRRCP